MPNLSTLFGLISRKGPELDPELFEIAYTANDDFRKKVTRKDYERAEKALFAILPEFPLFRRQLSRNPIEDPNIIPNRQALILLWVRADGQFRRYNRQKPIYLHSVEVTEIFLGMAKRLSDRGTPILPRERVRRGVRRGLLHDMLEDFKTTIDEIKELFGVSVARSVANMSTPTLTELAQDRKFKGITQQYIDIPDNQANEETEAQLENLKRRHVSTYVNLKARLQLQFKMSITRELTLVDCLLRGADNIHALISDTQDLRKGIVRLQAEGDPKAPDMPDQPITLHEGALRDSVSDRSNYQTALYRRIDELKEIAQGQKASFAKLSIFDAAKKELRATFEKAKAELGAEMTIALETKSDPATPLSLPQRAKNRLQRTAGTYARYIRAMSQTAVL